MSVVFRRLLQGLLDLRVNVWAQALTLAAVTLIAFLGGLFLLLLHNLNEELLRVRGDVLFQVYWQPGAEMTEVRKQWEGFSSLPHLMDVQTYTPEEAMSALSRSLDREIDLDWRNGGSPLPATALLSFAPPAAQNEQINEAENLTWTKEMLDYLQGLPGVQSVRFNPMRTELSGAWSKLSSNLLWPLVIFLLVVLALVVGNTIKLSQMFRRDEIEILRIVGARDWYINLPLIAGGTAQGLVGALLALGMLKIVQLSLENVLNFPPYFFRLSFLPAAQVLLLAGVLTAVGMLSSFVAVKR
ncbi:MAG: cell division protein FtsX [Oceanidesulfovibrio sp.]